MERKYEQTIHIGPEVITVETGPLKNVYRLEECYPPSPAQEIAILQDTILRWKDRFNDLRKRIKEIDRLPPSNCLNQLDILCEELE